MPVSPGWRQSADSVLQPWKFLFSSKEQLRCIIVICIIMIILGLQRRGPLGPSAEQISDLRSDNARGFGENRVVSGGGGKNSQKIQSSFFKIR